MVSSAKPLYYIIDTINDCCTALVCRVRVTQGPQATRDTRYKIKATEMNPF